MQAGWGGPDPAAGSSVSPSTSTSPCPPLIIMVGNPGQSSPACAHRLPSNPKTTFLQAKVGQVAQSQIGMPLRRHGIKRYEAVPFYSLQIQPIFFPWLWQPLTSIAPGLLGPGLCSPSPQTRNAAESLLRAGIICLPVHIHCKTYIHTTHTYIQPGPERLEESSTQITAVMIDTASAKGGCVPPPPGLCFLLIVMNRCLCIRANPT